MKKIIMLAVLGGLFFASCVSRESIVYYQDIDQQTRVVGTHDSDVTKGYGYGYGYGNEVVQKPLWKRVLGI